MVATAYLIAFSTFACAYQITKSTSLGGGMTGYDIRCDNGSGIYLKQDANGAIYGTNNGSYFMRNGSSLSEAARATCGE